MSMSARTTQKFGSYPLPKKIGVLGYGAIGSAFVEVLLKNHPGECVLMCRSQNCGLRQKRGVPKE